jgi:putative endonuclease
MACERTYYVYIMASKSRVVYVGVTGFLMAQVLRHRAGEGGEFTRRYQVHRWFTFRRFGMSEMRSRMKPRSRSGGGRRK